MANLQSITVDLNSQLENILQAKARNLAYGVSTLLFKISYGTSLILSDRINEEYYVDESYLSSFRDVYTNRAYKYLRLDDWEVEIHFQGKYCRKIDIVCTVATFFASKIESRQISGCCIKFALIINPRDIAKLNTKSIGYLRRIYKKNSCQKSVNISREMRSLIGFVPLKKKLHFGFDYKPWKQQQHSINPLQTLSPLGLQALNKLRYFIRKQDIHDFVINHQVSKEASDQLQELIMSKRIKKEEAG